MKKKLGVCLFVVAIFAVSLFCFAACDGGSDGGDEGHAHTYSVLKHDDTSHWYECECGEKDESTVTAHTGGTATCTDKAECDICHTAYGALDADNHTSTEYVYESNHDGTHTKTHACCHVAEGEAENCGGGSAPTCKTKSVCATCHEEYGSLDPTNHETQDTHIAQIAGTETHAETYVCCGAQKGEATACSGGTATCINKAECDVCHEEYGELGEHTGGTATCIKRAECNVCHEEYGDLDANNHAQDTYHYESNNDGTHKKLYDCCDEVAAESESCSGGTATCISKAECTDCGGEHGDYANHTFTAWDTSDATYDKPKCSVDGCGEVDTDQSNWFNKTVTAQNQDLLMTGESFAISLTGVSNYDSVQSIMLGSANLGTDIAALQIPDTVKNDSREHGEQTLTVTVLTNDNAPHVIQVPVTLVTAALGSADACKEYLYICNAKPVVYGYYTLTGNVTYQFDYASSDFSGFDYWGADTGFQGTLDGRGYTLTAKGVDQTGLIAVIRNAAIKNITIVDGWRKGYANAFLLARGVFNTTFENVTFKYAAGSTNNNVGMSGGNCNGWICGVEFNGNTLKNVSIEDTQGYGSVFGCKFANNTIENLTVNGQKSIEGTYTEIGHYGATSTEAGESIGYGDAVNGNVWIGLDA